MGPWRAAQQFVGILEDRGELDRVASVHVDLFGSLAKTGKGHPDGGQRLAALPMPIETPADLAGHCRAHGLTIPEVVRANERVWRDDRAIGEGLRRIWDTMRRCVFRGTRVEGILPGGLGVVRRASAMSRERLGPTRFEDVDSWMAAIRAGGRE